MNCNRSYFNLRLVKTHSRRVISTMYFNYVFLVELSMQRLGNLTMFCWVNKILFAATKFYNKIKYIILTMIFIVKITMQVLECRIVISCKIVDNSMKFKFLHKISVIQEMFHVFFNLLRGPVSLQHVRGPYTARGPRVVHPCDI